MNFEQHCFAYYAFTLSLILFVAVLLTGKIPQMWRDRKNQKRLSGEYWGKYGNAPNTDPTTVQFIEPRKPVNEMVEVSVANMR